MSKHPGRVDVATEVGYCNFCARTRNLRVEAHRLGSLVRTIVTCESCHRTLTTTVGVASEEPKAEAVAVEEKAPAPARKPAARPAAKPSAKAATTKKSSTEKPTAKRSPKAATAARAKPAPGAAAKAKPKAPAKPRSTGTRRAAR